MPSSHPSLLSSLRSLPRAAWVLFFGTFVNKVGTFVIPFLTLYLTHQGYSLAAAGIALGAYGVGNLMAGIIGGHLADRLGRRWTIAVSMFSGAAAMMLLSQARAYWLIVALAALTGLTGEMYRPASSALLADLVPAGQRVTAYSALRAAFNAGWAFGPALAGLIAERGWFWLFAGDAFTSALYGVVALLALPASTGAPAGRGGWGEVLRLMRNDGRLLRMLAAVFAVSLIFMQQSSTFGLHVVHLGFPAATYGLILSLNGAIIVFCELPLTTITRRFPARPVIALGYFLTGVAFALNGLARTVPELVACMCLFTLGEMLAMPMASAYIADLAPASMRGRYMGVYGMTWTLALIVGPAAGMALMNAAPRALWFSSAGLGALAAMLILGAVGPVRARETAVASEGRAG
jgi:MFS family permease